MPEPIAPKYMTKALKEEIWGLDDLDFEDIGPLPEWKEITLRVLCLTGTQREIWESFALAARQRGNFSKVRQMLIAMSCVYPETRERIWSDDEIGRLGSKSSKVLDRILDVCLRVSGISAAEVEDIKGNLPGGPGDDSTSSSA